MPLYELVCITARSYCPKRGKALFAPIQSLTQTSTSLILANGGVVRHLDYWGFRSLPQKMKRGDGESLTGDYWTMKFDANPPTVAALNERLKLDPRVLRWTTLKLGSTLEEVTAPPKDITVKYNRTSYVDAMNKDNERMAGRSIPGR